MPGMVDRPHETYLFRAAANVGESTDAEEAACIESVPRCRVLDLGTEGEFWSA